MNQLISSEYRELNRQLHKRPDYGAGAPQNAPIVAKVCRDNGLRTVLDYGCGKGRLAIQLEGEPFTVYEYDPAIPGKDEDPPSADLVVCLDVLEHVEPEKLKAVIQHVQAKTGKAFLANINLRKALKSLPDGRNAHLIVEPADWWMRQLAQRFRVIWKHADDRSLTALFTP